MDEDPGTEGIGTRKTGNLNAELADAQKVGPVRAPRLPVGKDGAAGGESQALFKRSGAIVP